MKYSYDENGNIISIKENGVKIVRYVYDCVSRLVREDNKKLNKTYIFSYDKGGNIIERMEYAYNTIPTDKSTGGIRFEYNYHTYDRKIKWLSNYFFILNITTQ